MENTRTYICNTDTFFIGKGYICLEAPDYDLPEKIAIEGYELIRKPRFHVSLLAVKDVLEQYPDKENLEQGIRGIFCEFSAQHEIAIERFTEFRFCERDDGRKTLVVCCNVSNLDGFFDTINEQLGLEVAYQPTHITLYTLTLNEGIGLNTKDMLEDLSQVTVNVPKELKQIFNI